MSPSQEASGRKRSRIQLFQDSGMTEVERRKVRHKQRNLHEKIATGPRDADEPNMKFLSKVRDENNELFDSVRYTREAVLDAENAGLLVDKTLLEVDKLRRVARFDAEKVARTLRSKLSDESPSGRHFNWIVLGRECGLCFNAVPSGVRFLAGTVDMEGEKVVRKARAKKQTVKQDDAPEVRPQVMDEKTSEGDSNALSAAEKVMKDLEKLLKKRSKQELQKKVAQNPNADEDTLRRMKEHGPEVEGAKFLMNPRSFTQSVENLFNFSFLVKRGRAAIGVRSAMERDNMRQPGLWVRHRHEEQDGSQPVSTQAVVSFTMRDWRRICEAHKLEQCDIPHRIGCKQNAQAPASQSQPE